MSRAITLRRLTYIGLPTAGLALGYYNYPKLKGLFPGATIEVPVRVRGPDGKAMASTKTFGRLSPAEIDQKIRENASGQRTLRPNGLSESHILRAFYCTLTKCLITFSLAVPNRIPRSERWH